MNDNQLFKLLIGIIRTGLTAQGITATVQQMNQPHQQGVPATPTVFIQKIGFRRHGWLGSDDVYDEDQQKEIHTETQMIETMFQVNALAIQSPSNITQLTASDLVSYAAAILQSNATVKQLTAQDVHMYRIIDSRNPYFTDDKDRFEADPSFDFTVQHKLVLTSEIPVIQSTELKIYEI